jgi:transposase
LAAASNVEVAYTPANASWLNRIEPQFAALRYFALDGTDHATHQEQGSMIRRYIIWRNNHAYDERLRSLGRRPRGRRRARRPFSHSGAGAVGFPSQRGEILLRERSSPMGEMRRKFDKDFREGAVRLVRETGKPIAQVARDLGVNEGTLGNWVNADRRRRGGGDGALSEDERAELARLRKENAELAMRCDVLKRSVALWVSDAMGR